MTWSPVSILRRHAAILMVCVAYLAITVTYSFMIGAWEANDEMHHVANTEYIRQHHQLFPLRLESWHETHQPPLYYLAAALWQRTLRIPAFHPRDPEATRPTVNDDPELVYTHRYNPEERAAAVAVHKLRLLSVLFGLATVVLTYCAARIASTERAVAVASAAFVAFLPKFNVVSAVFSNDSLVIALCSLGLVLALAYRRVENGNRRTVIAFGLGVAAGAALLTKLNSVPVMAVLLGSILITRTTNRARIVNAAIAALGFTVTAGWWLVRNYRTSGDLLGQNGTNDWLNTVLPGNIAIVPWTDSERFLNFVPARLVRSFWYQGGWNQFFAPFGVNFLLSCLAAIALFGAVKAFVTGGSYTERFGANFALLLATTASAFATVFIIAKTTSQGEGRIAYVGLSALAVLLVTGMMEALSPSAAARKAVAFWPVLLFIFNVYVFCCFIIPWRAF